MGKTYTQCEHIRINAREYPGTRQICKKCDEPTGHCEDDILSVGDLSPLCGDCYDELKPMEWDLDPSNVKFDRTVLFDHSYCFDGLEDFGIAAEGKNGNYKAWPAERPSTGRWSLYRDSDGMLAFEKFNSEEECKEAAEKWNQEKLN